MTQNDMVLKYLHDFGSITPLDALREFGCMRLASRIADLKKDGHSISRVMERGQGRYGNKVRYARYRLEG